MQPPSARSREAEASAVGGDPPAFVVTSKVTVAVSGTERLEAAFATRLGEVDQFPGFQRLEVWRDTSCPGSYLMVSWWDSREAFTAYLRSDQHRRSHARIAADLAPRGAGLQRFERVST